MTELPAFLEVDGLQVAYRASDARREFVAVSDVSFSGAEGDVIMLVGPSGCGKTTVLNVLAGFVRPTAGTVRLEGVPVAGPSPERFVVFQGFDQLLYWKTVYENIAFPLRVTRKAHSETEARERVLEVLQMTGLSDFQTAYPHTLSGGMKQRLAIARALALTPKVLLMDEPFASLDALTRAHLQRELHQLWLQSRPTIVFVTHSVEEAVILGTKLVVFTSSPARVAAQLEGGGDPELLRERVNELLGVLRR